MADAALAFDLCGAAAEVVGAVEGVTVKTDAVDVGAISEEVGETVGVDVSTGACTVSVDAAVAVTIVMIDGVVAADTAIVGVSTVSADAVWVITSGVITAVAVVVVDVVTVTCCETISDEPMDASLAASRAAAGDISILPPDGLTRARPRPSVSGPEPFEPPEGVAVFAFAFACICTNAALSVCCCFLLFSAVFFDLFTLEAVAVEGEPPPSIMGSCSPLSSPSFS